MSMLQPLAFTKLAWTPSITTLSIMSLSISKACHYAECQKGLTLRTGLRFNFTLDRSIAKGPILKLDWKKRSSLEWNYRLWFVPPPFWRRTPSTSTGRWWWTSKNPVGAEKTGLKPVPNRFGTGLEPVWNWFGTGLEQVWNRFKQVLNFVISYELVWHGLK